MAAGAVEALRLGQSGDAQLVFRVVNAECLAGNDDLGSLIPQGVDRAGDGFLREGFAVDKGMIAFQKFSGGQLDVADVGFPLRPPGIDARPPVRSDFLSSGRR